jgi:predicted ABC-class ATPase
MKKELEDLSDMDFGFSFVDEDYEEVKETSQKLQQDHQDIMEEVKDLRRRLDLLHRSIVPFLDNLCKNPDKSTIHWPNRVEKIEQYKQKLKQIVEGS